MGITVNLAPVAETLSPENRAFLESRSYGPDPAFVEAAAAAFIRAMDAAGIACVVKHFPGNSGADPHSGPARLEAGRAELDAAAAPFAGLIQKLRPPALMVSHVVAAARDGERPASLSAAVIQGWLREELGFRGVIIADDFSMAAVARGLSLQDAAVEALAAGADMVMVWPSSAAPVHRAVLAALEDGRLPRRRLLDAAERIIAEKLRYGLVPFNKILSEKEGDDDAVR
jgi:beta-N-acetylhexosaminidase